MHSKIILKYPLKTDNATYKLTTEVLNALNNKSVVAGIFCNLQKAFDCVNYEIILAKLEFYGIKGLDLNLYKSFPESRYQRVSLSGTLSGWTGIRHGVPQGSILGPLLFLLYVNDLPNNIERISVPILYTDDTSILFSHSDLNDLTNTINNTFKIVNNWFTANYLSLNISKTHFIYFSSKLNKTVELNIHYDKYTMPTKYYTKLLGVTIDCMMTWSNHIELLYLQKN
jgi:hypothetical protein